MLRHVEHAQGVVLVALAVALVAVLITGLASAEPVRAHPPCTHGLSSIGPVYLENGKVVAGDTTPITEACLP